MSTLNFRNATHDDIPALVDLVTSAYRGDASKQGWTTEADLLDGQRIDADMLRADLAQPQSLILLAHDSDRLVACAHIAVEADETCSDGKTAYFGMFSVSPDAQGGGIGKALLAEAERSARDTLVCMRMRMTVIDCREELIAFYIRRGYARTGIKKPFPYGDSRYGLPKRGDLQFEVLEKTLTDAAPIDASTQRCIGASGYDTGASRMSDWIFVCPTEQLLPGEKAVAWDGDTPIVVINLDGEFYALEDRCTHDEFELSSGDVDTAEGSIVCVLHGARFDIREGTALCAPAYEPVAKFPVKIEHGGVWTRDDR